MNLYERTKTRNVLIERRKKGQEDEEKIKN